MTIDRSGPWWTGQDADDVLEYLDDLGPGGSPVDEVLPQRCACGCAVFAVYRSDGHELSYLVCRGCDTETYVTDSQRYVAEQGFDLCTCPCGYADYQVCLEHRTV